MQDARNGIYYVGDTVAITLYREDAFPTLGGSIEATDYSVVDYYGNTVATGAVSGHTLTLGSSWDPGWYRVYLTGPTNDTLFGFSYGATAFCVIRPHANFQTVPVSTQSAGFFGFTPNGQGTNTVMESSVEMITRGCLGLGVGRLSMIGGFYPHQSDTNDTLAANVEAMENVVNPYWLAPTNPDFLDPARPRYQWAQFTNRTWDSVALTGIVGWWANIVLAQPEIHDGNQVFVESISGGGTGGSDVVKVYYPNDSTLVETHDNLITQYDGMSQINTDSSYIRATMFSTGNTRLATNAKTAIGSGFFDTVAAAVATGYAAGITHWEGPENEPTLNPSNTLYPESVAYQLRVFAASVHAGHPDAKALGPAIVNITDPLIDRFIAAGGLDHTDEISFHSYNSGVNGDINQARFTIEAFLAKVADAGHAGKPMWQTEALHSITPNFSVFHPRRARVTLLMWLLWEQYGIPREKNPYWYDWSHGFWSYPSWLFNQPQSDKSPNPQVVLMNVLAQETFGKAHHHRIDFGSVPANKIFLGSVYGDSAAGSVAVMVAASYMAGSSVTLTVSGSTSPLTVVDGLGNATTVSQSGGRVTVDVSDIPTYVRLPAGVNVWVYSVNDWGPNPSPSVSAVRLTTSLGGGAAPAIADDKYMEAYTGTSTTNGVVFSTSGLPDSAEITFADNIEIDRVIVWCGPAYQSLPGLIDFDVDTWDGASWTTRATVTRTAPTSFLHGTNFTGVGCQRETFWDEQWIEDVKLPSPVTASGVRIYVRDATYGGEPDADAVSYGGFEIGGGMATPKIAIQEISVISPTAVTPGNAYETEVLADNPRAYYKFEETSGTLCASSVNSPATDATIIGTYTRAADGIVNGSTYSLQTTSTTKPRAPGAAELQVGDTFTIECWIYITDGSVTGRRLPSQAGSGGYTWGITGGEQVVIGKDGGGGGTIAVSTDTVPLGSPVHLVFAKNGGVASYIYINGTDVTGAVSNVTCSSLGQVTDLCNAFGTDERVDAIAIYPTCLSAARVLAHYVAGAAPSIPVLATTPLIESS